MIKSLCDSVKLLNFEGLFHEVCSVLKDFDDSIEAEFDSILVEPVLFAAVESSLIWFLDLLLVDVAYSIFELVCQSAI